MRDVAAEVAADMAGALFADVLGWCLAFLLVFFAMAGPLRRDRGAALAYLLTTFLHVAATVVYVYLPGILPIRNDSHVFHRYGIRHQWAPEWSFTISSQFYKEYIAHVYYLFGDSYFLASMLSIYAFAVSVLVFVKFMELLNVRRGKGWAVLLFGALPTAVLYGSVPLREPYQVLFFMLACYCMLRFRLTNRPLHLVAAIIFALLMGMLHKGLIIYAPFLIVVMLFVRLDRASSRPGAARRNVHLHRAAGVALAIGFFVAMSFVAHETEEVQGTTTLAAATSGGLIDYTAEHRAERHIVRGRTAYGVTLDTSSPVRLIHSAFLIFIYYMLTPFPWQVRTVMDLYALGEVMLRLVMLFAIFRMWRRGGPVPPQIITLLIIVYMSMAFLWAAGTFNYGTATRHHMVHLWILLLLGVPALLRTVPALMHGRLETQPAGGPMRLAQPGAGVPLGDAGFGAVVMAAPPPPRLRAALFQPRRLETAGVATPVPTGGLGHGRGLGRE